MGSDMLVMDNCEVDWTWDGFEMFDDDDVDMI
jgi:hypothetical protein